MCISSNFKFFYILTLLFCIGNKILFGQGVQIHLSDSATIYLITCESNPNHIITNFGHSAIRVCDPVSTIDNVYFYGGIELNKGWFLLNLFQNNLKGEFKTIPFNSFKLSYTFYNRKIIQQPLILTPAQKHKLFQFLNITDRNHNREYQYHYFENNCTTRLRDLFKTIFLNTNLEQESEKTTYRKSLKPYLENSPWVKFVFDLCLGIPADKSLKSGDEIFLPLALKNHLERKGIIKTLPMHIFNYPTDYRPMLVTSMGSLVLLGLTILEYKKRKSLSCLNSIIFMFTGLCGAILVICWLIYDHVQFGWNLNLLWLSPANLFFMFFNKKFYYFLVGSCSTILLIFWSILPQEMNLAVMPLLIALSVRYFIMSKL